MRPFDTKPLRRQAHRTLLGLLLLLSPLWSCAEETDESSSARPWTFWYWMQAGISREGILADLEAMQEIGLGGAYLMPIQGITDPPHVDPPVEQLSPEFWDMVRYAMEQADRLGLQLAMHACDGFAVAGGPWVTPELSMQELVWSRLDVTGGEHIRVRMPQPTTREDYYRDIALFAFPALPGARESSATIRPVITSSFHDGPLEFLLDETNTEPLRQYEPGWIQYAFDEPFTCRSIRIRPHDRNFQAMRLLVQVSEDGEHFTDLVRLDPPRHGWQSMNVPLTWSVPATTARAFRFVFDPEGSEPGAEDLDFAKWSPNLKVRSIHLSAEPCINQIEGKNGSVWRIAANTTADTVSESECVSVNTIHDLGGSMDATGMVEISLPEGMWTLLRMGHTSTGHTNATGGAGMGLEIDKFSVAAAELQFDKWFGEAIRQAGPVLAERVLKVFHVDSWECGSQNWTIGFEDAFKQQHGYSLYPYLPVLAGIPVDSPERSEAFLLDFRRTIAELLTERFFKIMKRKAAEAGCVFSAECVAPTMVGDSLRHFGIVDLPMGEFWLRSPTHDKPNDILDAISGGHVYGKPIIQAEAFTQLRIAWDEHPAMLKALADRHFALGINRLVFHVFAHNPWMDRVPGMTLNGVGLYFQRDQTWWKPGKAWIDYLVRCQELLQEGQPVVDLAIFTGDDLPSRALLPEDLTGVLPGLLGEKRLHREAERLANPGTLLVEQPKGVKHSANIRDPLNWLNPLNGYKYDSINRDALLRLARVEKGRVVLPGGMAYRVLVVPGARRTAPNAAVLSLESAEKIATLIEQGATVLFEEPPVVKPGLSGGVTEPERIKAVQSLLQRGIIGPWMEPDLTAMGILPDVSITDFEGKPVESVDWTHRSSVQKEIYFITNQAGQTQQLVVTFRDVREESSPVLYDPVSNIFYSPVSPVEADDRKRMVLELGPYESRFVLFGEAVITAAVNTVARPMEPVFTKELTGSWTIRFDPLRGGPEEPQRWEALMDWSRHPAPTIRHYSGTATCCIDFDYIKTDAGSVWLRLEGLHDLAIVRLNGREAGTAWTWPYEVRVDPFLMEGPNKLCIEVTNTWANRIIGDSLLPDTDRITGTNAPFRLEGSPLLPAGLTGPVILIEKYFKNDEQTTPH